MKVARIDIDGEPVYIECVDVEIIGAPIEAVSDYQSPSRLPVDPGRETVGLFPRGGIDPEKLRDAWNDGMRSVRHAAGAAFKQLGKLPKKPDRMVVEVGLKMSAQAGLILTNASGEASVKVTLEWGGAAAGGVVKEVEEQAEPEPEAADADS